ncbi:MAG TPA: PAS domain-containing protein, partial [Pyrinomonadaceae bacterium]|nr:PAS domain-containing protein [Pyrinomonadaceae bacterium]
MEGDSISTAQSSQHDTASHQSAVDAARFQAHLLNSVGQAVIATDLRGIVTYWNKFAEKLYGWSAEEATGRSIMELTPAPPSQKRADEIMARLRAGESWSGEFPVRRRDGTTFTAEVTNVPLHDNKGELIG